MSIMIPIFDKSNGFDKTVVDAGYGRAQRDPEWLPFSETEASDKIVHRVTGQVLRRVAGQWVGVKS